MLYSLDQKIIPISSQEFRTLIFNYQYLIQNNSSFISSTFFYFKSLEFILNDLTIQVSLIYLSACILALYYGTDLLLAIPILHVFSFIHKDAIRPIKDSIKTLSLIYLTILIILFIFSSILFFTQPSRLLLELDFQQTLAYQKINHSIRQNPIVQQGCNTMISCFFNVLHQVT